MKQLSNEDKQIAAQLKARLWYSISKILESELPNLQTDSTSNTSITANPLYVSSLVELAYNQLLNLGEDLERFARHAKRKTVTPEDMFLACRRNADLQGILADYWREMNQENVEEAGKDDKQTDEMPQVTGQETKNTDDNDDDDVFGDSEDDEEFIRLADRKIANR
ncbi:hypothetical protein WICPIJ_005569 [Wickerhamomyces pijperi]|uniref:MHF histone-fold complex subunit 1 n=1 Tax=Wickerhamomyces pijperi TaxID=599730 RepID=A0A9P8Q5E9_WICPI|nr:hypothetical protein WICPIJ_005569 [Wickerhamomyces pijperi]